MNLIALAQLAPIVWCLVYSERRAAVAFLVSATITGALGQILSRLNVAEPRLYRREGILIVVVGWLLASCLGALPYLFSGEIADPIDALFESASGFTTTGATILTDIEATGRGVLFWRSMTQWLGGLGIIVLFVALLSELGPGARFLYSVEVAGPTTEVLHPRVHETAVVLLRIYIGLSIGQVALLLIAGLDLYDAITHTFSTVSTAGFSPRNESVAAFASVWVRLIIIAFMFVGGINFSLLYALRRGLSRLWRDRELRIYSALTVAATFLIAVDLSGSSIPGESSSALDSLFQVVSILTTTGFTTADFDRWPDTSRALLLALMMIGGCAGSTSSGIKVMRVLIVLRTALREVKITFSPKAVIPVTIAGKPVPESVTRSVSGFLVLYFFTLIGGTLILAFGGNDLITSGSAALACLSNIGPGLEAVGPTANYATFAGWEKLLLVVLMWLGRLEILAIAAVARRSFWRG